MYIMLTVDADIEKLQGRPSVECAEAQAIWRAILFTKCIGNENVIFESDSLRVIFRLRNHVSDLSGLALVVADFRELQSFFTSCSFSHVQREGNSVAYALASLALSKDVLIPSYWREEVPICISHLVAFDAST